MAASDSRSDNDDTTFPMMRAEDSTAKVGIPTARQSNSHRRPSITHARILWTPSRAKVKHPTMNTPTMSSGSHGEQAKRTFAAALRFAGVVVAAAMAVLVLGLLWVSGCKSGTGDEALAQCGGVQRNLLGIGSPLILLLGGLAVVRPYLSGLAGTRSLVDLAGRGLVPTSADAGRADDDRARGAPLKPSRHPAKRSKSRPWT